MRNVLFAGVAFLALSGCAAFNNLFPAGSVAGTIVTDAENAAVAACGFLPTAETVAGIIATGNPALQTATAIAQAICAAVVPKTQVTQAIRRTTNPNATVPTVSGVPVYGQFVH